LPKPESELFRAKAFRLTGLPLIRFTHLRAPVCRIVFIGFIPDVPVYEIPVREAKQILTGNGNASKMQFERSVRNMLQLSQPIKPDHASDALGLALIGLLRYDLKR